jgi:hypothetical protein
MSGLSLRLPDYIDRGLHRRIRSSVLKPVCGVPILGPAHSRPIVRSDSISMVSDRSLQYVDDAWSVVMVVHRAEDDRHDPWGQPGLDLSARHRRCELTESTQRDPVGHPDNFGPLHAMDGMPSRTPLLRAFAAGQGQTTTARWALLLSLAVPCFMPQTCPKRASGRLLDSISACQPSYTCCAA